MATEDRKAINRRHYLKNRERYKAEKLAYYHETYKARIDREAKAAYHKVWRAKNPEKARGTKQQRRAKQLRRTERYQTEPAFRARLLARQKQSAKQNPLRTTAMNLRLKYGISLEHRNDLLKAQGGKCAICGATDGYNFPQVDHCHKTDKVRGLLCQKCNHGIGLFKDDPALLRAAANYLEQSRKT